MVGCEQFVESCGWVDDEQGAGWMGGEQESVADCELGGVSDGGGQVQMPLWRHSGGTVWVGLGEEETVGFADHQDGAGEPAERGDDGAVGDAAPAVQGRQPVHDIARAGPWQAR